jgi:hypothetical protein
MKSETKNDDVNDDDDNDVNTTFDALLPRF